MPRRQINAAARVGAVLDQLSAFVRRLPRRRRAGRQAFRGGRIFYGWWIVAAGFGIEGLIGALVFHAYGAYVVLLREEFGWSKTLFSAAFAMARAESGIFGPLQGWLTDRFGPRVLIRVGMIIFGVGFLLFSRVETPVGFFLAFFVMAVGSSLGGYLPIGVAIVGWFRRRRALALSISGTGMSTGGLLTPLIVAVMTQIGWRWTAFLSGVLVLAVGVPLAQIIRHRPEPYGLNPDGDPGPGPGPPGSGRGMPGAAHGTPASGHGDPTFRRDDPGPAAGASAATTSERPAVPPRLVHVDFTAREAVRTPAFWYISFGHGAALLVVSAVLVHMIVHVTERLGYSLQQAAFVVGLMTVTQIAGQLTGGWLGDRISKRAISAACMLGHAAGLLVLAFATAFWMVALFGILHGLSWGMRGPLMAAIRADYFGSAAFGTITGISSGIVMFGMMGGPLVAGIIADRTGSYVLGFTILAAIAALGSVFFLLARRPAPPARIS